MIPPNKDSAATTMSGEETPSRAILLGFGAVGRHVLHLLVQRLMKRMKQPNILIIAIADSSGGVSCPDGLPLSRLLTWKEDGGSVVDFEGSEGSGLLLKYANTLDMVKRVAQQGDILLDATPVNLETGGVGLECCLWAAEHGVHLVLANKAPLVLKYSELIHKAAQNPFSEVEFSATVCGGLPVINVGKRDIACCGRIDEVQGIFNSTSNFVLSRMELGESGALALQEAQAVGIAEADASLDLEGYDTANKLVIICNAVLGLNAKLEDVKLEGITKISPRDVQMATNQGKVYRLVASAKRKEIRSKDVIVDHNEINHAATKEDTAGFSLSVCPQLVDRCSFLGQCSGTSMCVTFTSEEFETISLKTNEEGVFPTAAAMLRDCCTIRRQH